MNTLIAMVLLTLGVFLAIIFPIAAYRVYQDLPKIVNRLNTIITILNDRD